VTRRPNHSFAAGLALGLLLVAVNLAGAYALGVWG